MRCRVSPKLLSVDLPQASPPDAVERPGGDGGVPAGHMSDRAQDLRSRRALLTGGFAGLAALVANAVLRPLPTAAASGDPVILGNSNEAGSSTNIASSTSDWTLQARNTRTSTGNGFKVGVLAMSENGIGALVQGPNGLQANAPADGGIGVHGLKFAHTGPAVKGQSTCRQRLRRRLWDHEWVGAGRLWRGTAQGNGTSGVARGSGSGIYGQSDNGRGGRFRGKAAQIRLEPATTTTHPASGDAGQHVLDKSKRLWLCKGGTSWVKIVVTS